MDRLGLSIAMIVAAVLAGVGTAWSDKGEDKEPSKAEMAAAAKVPIDQAIKAASDKANGKIIEAELDWEGGRLVWEVGDRHP